MLTVKAALEEATAAIGRIDAQALFTHFLGVDRAWLVTHEMDVLTESQDARLDMAVAQRSMGIPVAYVTGTREFYSRDFEVTPDVLIPRPETEVLVEAVLARAARGAACLDLGTGSGAIAVTLACEREDLRVSATDASAAALAIARRNAKSHACDVGFHEGRWYEPVAGRRFDIIVSNPPYVAAGDAHLGQGDLRFEPAMALTDGSGDGLDSIRALVAGAAAHLEPGGWLLFEHGHDQAPRAAALLLGAGFAELVSIPDLAGIPRVAGGKLNA